MRSFYLSDGPDRVLSTASTGGPWSPDAQHGGPPAALLTRAVEDLSRSDERTVGRLTMELLGPVPVGPLTVDASVLRPGRTVALCEATLYDERSERACARATAWLFPRSGDGPNTALEPLGHGPADGVEKPRPENWYGGYLDAVEWRWIRGSVSEPGPGVVWMRPRVQLMEGEPLSPVQRLMACADSASGASAALDPARWAFLNTELTVHVLRPPEGEWLCLDARTTVGSGSIGLAEASVYDARGLVARSAQALLITRR